MAAALPFLMMAGQAVQAVGSIKAANAAQDAAEFNAQQAEKNAALTREQAADNERTYRINSQKDIGKMQAGFAANGLSLEGSASDVLAEAYATSEFDVQKIKHGASLQELSYKQQAEAERKKGGAAMTGGYLSAAGTLLSGGAKAGSYL
jgi:hypothetical protein